MSLYEIKLSDGDRVTYETDMTLEELKHYISANDFVELPRSGSVPYGRGGVRFVPTLASYQTKSIVYVNHDVEAEKCREYNQKIIESHMPIINKIFEYEFSKRMKRWLRWNIADENWDSSNDELKEHLYFYKDEYLETILNKCKKYKCRPKYGLVLKLKVR